MNYFVSVSGGLDSTALSILCSKDKKWRYIFADTGDEFPQVYDHLDKMENKLGIRIIRVKNEKYNSLGEYELKQKYFPSPQSRFCTRMFKIEPIEYFLGDFAPYKLAIGLRADEKNRTGNLADYAIYPLITEGIKKEDILIICQEYDLIPNYPWYMSRGGCYSCFFKSKPELLALAKYEPDLFDELVNREEEVQDYRGKYYSMFDRFRTWGGAALPLRTVKEIVDSQEQIDMFEKYKYMHNDCGIFCRK